MARRKKHHYRGRSVRGTSNRKSGTIELVIGLAAGAVGSKIVHGVLGNINPKISAAVMALGGAYMAMGAKNPLMQGVFLGVAATGTNELTTELGIVHGVGNIAYGLNEGSTANQVISGSRQAGYQLAYGANQVISGNEEEDDENGINMKHSRSAIEDDTMPLY